MSTASWPEERAGALLAEESHPEAWLPRAGGVSKLGSLLLRLSPRLRRPRTQKSLPDLGREPGARGHPGRQRPLKSQDDFGACREGLGRARGLNSQERGGGLASPKHFPTTGSAASSPLI